MPIFAATPRERFAHPARAGIANCHTGVPMLAGLNLLAVSALVPQLYFKSDFPG